ncbi:hypothetical protein OIU74_010153 [Salix koriyanagi]|uniref:Uncharacterized protein n=1 Tax=Salix koriyanagi TaxID=2511006 RepID=A0A9Q0QLM1_9ROSI|nr:hypothetical protein OIU74_010153 [Salix koriyanagi]
MLSLQVSFTYFQLPSWKKERESMKKGLKTGVPKCQSGGTSPRNYSEVATKVEIQTRAVRGGFTFACPSYQRGGEADASKHPKVYIVFNNHQAMLPIKLHLLIVISLSLILMPYLRVIHGSNTEPLKTLLQDYLMGRPDVSIAIALIDRIE